MNLCQEGMERLLNRVQLVSDHRDPSAFLEVVAGPEAVASYILGVAATASRGPNFR